ncbi:glycoside hydrolase family 127 protein [Confluentibacter lentus]|uniref:glycoside hydrolase family 127 protein n=1 Tax=Confluentibacter lentus TaxID=1699412 RepID=UPI000C28E212|nr:beta-L-arabinofuranosidase domain-containing protein [Confluentibacter lentus]
MKHITTKLRNKTFFCITFSIILFVGLTIYLSYTYADLPKTNTDKVSLIPQTYAHATVKPFDLSEAKITGGYLGSYVERTRNIGILDLFEKMKKHGSFKNFKVVAEGLPDRHVGGFNEDEWVHKLLEAAGYFAPKSPLISDTFQPLIKDILASQDKDGYLQSYYQNPAYLKEHGSNVRFLKGGRHEFYVFGHLAQAGMAWKNEVGDDRLFKASLRYADLLCDLFGSKPLPYKYDSDRGDRKYEHPNHEMAMVELYRMTGNRRYLDFAAHTLDDYGFWSFSEVSGHCVQENLLLCGGADVYLETGKPEMLKHLEAMWMDVVERKSYVTGGVGNGVDSENYGKPYVLPNQQNYCETCASISKVFFDWRMLLATDHSKYADDMENTFYNAVLSGVSLSGTEIFYTNHVEEDGTKTKQPDGLLVGCDIRDSQRKPYFDVSCCAPNFQRLIGSLQQYLFTLSPDGVQAQLYGNAELKTSTVHLRETTDYPRDGRIQFDILADAKFELSLRIPKWTESTRVFITVNGKEVPQVKAGEYVKLNQFWKKGDKIILEFDMKPRLIKGRDQVAAEKGKLAIMRGPLVYCIESPDNRNINISDVALPLNTIIKEEKTNDLNGTVRLSAQAWDVVNQREVQISTIPYHLWANRGESTMKIWIPWKN